MIARSSAPNTATPDNQPTDLDPSVRTLLRRTTLYPAWVVLAVLIASTLLDLSVSGAVRYAPLLVSIVVLGLPHGAADHLVLLRLQGQPVRLSPLLRTLGPYLALAGAYLALWFVVPQLAFVAFIALTWFHWGQGDLHGLLLLTDAHHLSSRWTRGLCVFVRGGLPMLIPLLSFPEVYVEVATQVVARLGVAPGSVIDTLVSPTIRTGAGLVLLVAAATYVGTAFQNTSNSSRSAWLEDGFEAVLLAAFFWTVDPIFAIGIYFCFWHAPRHIARLGIQDHTIGSALHTHDLGRALRRFVRQVFPTTGIAVLLLGLLYVGVPNPPTTTPGIVALYLILLAVLTLPHVWVVLQMDRREKIWTPDSVPRTP